MQPASNCFIEADQTCKQAWNDLLTTQLAGSMHHLLHWLSLHQQVTSPVLAAKTKA